MRYIDKVKEAADFVQAKLPGEFQPRVGVILGSGLGHLADELEQPSAIQYSDIPQFPRPTVAGHKGRLIAGKMGEKDVVFMQGRYHYYEGHAMQDIALPVRVMQLLGVQVLIATNAAGGLVESLHPGDLMVISDHINLMFDNPLIGPNFTELGPRFVATSGSYDPELIELAFSTADELGIRLSEGVYVATTGPVYETRATGHFFRLIGGHAVGMSTVPEVIAAVHGGMKVLAISCITDSVSEKRRGKLTHEAVLKVAHSAGKKLGSLVREVVRKL